MTKFEVGDLVKVEIDTDAFDEDNIFDDALSHIVHPIDVIWTVKKATEAVCTIEFEGMQSFHRVYIRPAHLIKVFDEHPGTAAKAYPTLESTAIIDPEYTIKTLLMDDRIDNGFYCCTSAFVWKFKNRMTDEARRAWADYCDEERDRAWNCYYADLVWAFDLRKLPDGVYSQLLREAAKHTDEGMTYSMEHDWSWWKTYNEFKKAYEKWYWSERK